MKKKKSEIIVTVVIIILILIFAGLGLRTYIERKQPLQTESTTEGNPPQQASAAPATSAAPSTSAAPATSGQARNATAVRVTQVVKDTIENSVLINGDVLAVNQVSIFPTVAGKISQTFFEVGDRINQGAVVAMVDPSRPGQVFSESPVTSTIGGTVLQTPVHVGDTVTTQTAVVVVGDLSNL
ncbi:MAG: hypothetical protein FWF26_05820, partial [Treponema sp.]|nr:hypothetical protein [Treponema sp.]